MGQYETKFCSRLGGVGEQKVLYEKKDRSNPVCFFCLLSKIVDLRKKK